jgi:hypothetical protein
MNPPCKRIGKETKALSLTDYTDKRNRGLRVCRDESYRISIFDVRYLIFEIRTGERKKIYSLLPEGHGDSRPAMSPEGKT